MRKIGFILLSLAITSMAYATDWAKKYPTDTALEVITPASGDARYVNIPGDTMTGQLISTLATGTSPFAVTSTTVNTNLNADLWDGYQFADYLDQAVKTTSAPTFATVDTGQGANELYDMDQNVLTTSSPTFSDITINGTNILRHIYYRS